MFGWTSKNIITHGTYRRVQIHRYCPELINMAAKTTEITETYRPSATMSLCLLFEPAVTAWCHYSFADKYYLLLQMSMWPCLLFFYFSSVRMLFPVVPMALLLCTKPNRACVLLSVPVTCSHSCSLFISLSLTPPPCISLLELTIEVHRETYMYTSGRGVKRGAENKEQDLRRGSLHLNACLWLSSD